MSTITQIISGCMLSYSKKNKYINDKSPYIYYIVYTHKKSHIIITIHYIEIGKLKIEP